MAFSASSLCVRGGDGTARPVHLCPWFCRKSLRPLLPRSVQNTCFFKLHLALSLPLPRSVENTCFFRVHLALSLPWCVQNAAFFNIHPPSFFLPRQCRILASSIYTPSLFLFHSQYRMPSSSSYTSLSPTVSTECLLLQSLSLSVSCLCLCLSLSHS